MRCSTCGGDNREARKFCAECGPPECSVRIVRRRERTGGKVLRLMRHEAGQWRTYRSIPNPTANNLAQSPRTYTPKHLADKILQSKSALEGERKTVTALFARPC
jgi:hypothetical protein